MLLIGVFDDNITRIVSFQFVYADFHSFHSPVFIQHFRKFNEFLEMSRFVLNLVC